MSLDIARIRAEFPALAITDSGRKRIYFDSLVYTPEGLGTLVSNVGPSQVLLGTDYPYDVGFYGTEDLVQAAGLSETDQAAVLGANAVRLLGLEALAAKHEVNS